MGTSPEVAKTDKLGRRSGPRRRYTIAEKRAMVEETLAHGASVPEVAQRYGVNANLISIWRRLYRQGLLVAESSGSQGDLLPVKVTTPTLIPTEQAVEPGTAEQEPRLHLEVEFPGGRRLHVRGTIDRALLRELINSLSSR